MHTAFNSSKPKTAYQTEEGAVESWDIQFRCRRALQGGGLVDDELQKIFVFYFPFSVGKEGSHGNSAQAKLDSQARGCRLEEYWKFWKDIDFFEGPYRDSPPFFINKSFAVGCGMQELFLDFSKENSNGQQLKMKRTAMELSLQGWCRALREMGRLVMLEERAQSPIAAYRGSAQRRPTGSIEASERFIYEVVLPSCRRENPNPVFTHFKRAEVTALLERYRTPLLGLFRHFCGSAPNAFAMLTPDCAPATQALHLQPVGKEASAGSEAAGSGGASREGSLSGGPGEKGGGGAEGINVEEFLLFCRTMDLCPALVSELSLRYASR
jgi:hypothetical protein